MHACIYLLHTCARTHTSMHTGILHTIQSYMRRSAYRNLKPYKTRPMFFSVQLRVLATDHANHHSCNLTAWNDAVEEACQKGIRIIAEPGGSIRDKDAIDCCNKYGVSLVFTNVRHFRHWHIYLFRDWVWEKPALLLVEQKLSPHFSWCISLNRNFGDSSIFSHDILVILWTFMWFEDQISYWNSKYMHFLRTYI